MTRKTDVEKKLFAIDLGNKSVKEISRTSFSPFSIPSRIINKDLASSGRFQNLGAGFQKKLSVSDYQILNQEDTFIFGKDINKLGKDDYILESLGFGLDRYKQKTYQDILSFSIAELARREEISLPVITADLVLGLPSSDYTESIVKYVLESASGQHSVIIDGDTFNVNIDTVWVIPQPIGTLYNLLLNDQGQVNDQSIIDKKIGIVDIGGGTKLYDVVQNFVIDENNRQQKETGIFTLYNRIADNTDISFQPNAFQIENIIRSGKITGTYLFKPNHNEQIDLTKMIEKEIRIYTQQVVAEVFATFKNFKTLDQIVFTSGGSQIIDKELVLQSIPNAIFVEDAEFSNVKGFLKFGLTQIAE